MKVSLFPLLLVLLTSCVIRNKPSDEIYDSFFDAVTSKDLDDAKRIYGTYDIDIDYLYGKRPLVMWAVEDGNGKMIAFLVKNGANVNFTDGVSTPLTESVSYKDGAIACSITEFLIRNGADVNYMTKYRMTPLIYAIEANNRNAVKLLLNSGAEPNSKVLTESEKTALDYAIENKNQEIIDLLHRHGAKTAAEIKNNPEGPKPVMPENSSSQNEENPRPQPSNK